MPRQRSWRLQRFIDPGSIDEGWARNDLEGAERNAILLQDAYDEEDEVFREDRQVEGPPRPVLAWPRPTVEIAGTACTASPPAVQTIVNLEHMRGMPARSVDCIVTSPPYNLGKRYSLHNDRMDDGAYLEWQGSVAAEITRILRPDGQLFLNVGWNSEHPERSVDVFLRYREHLRLQNRITWVKEHRGR